MSLLHHSPNKAVLVRYVGLKSSDRDPTKPKYSISEKLPWGVSRFVLHLILLITAGIVMWWVIPTGEHQFFSSWIHHFPRSFVTSPRVFKFTASTENPNAPNRMRDEEEELRKGLRPVRHFRSWEDWRENLSILP